MNHHIPWQEIINWIVSILIPALFVAWRRTASKTNCYSTIIDAIVQGVENASKYSNTEHVKRSIEASATKAGVQEHLDCIVQEQTGIDRPK